MHHQNGFLFRNSERKRRILGIFAGSKRQAKDKFRDEMKRENERVEDKEREHDERD